MGVFHVLSIVQMVPNPQSITYALPKEIRKETTAMPTGWQIAEMRQPPHKTNYKQESAFSRNCYQKYF